MTTTANARRRVDRAARRGWVHISNMRVSPLAQRALNQARVEELAADFDIEQLGIPVVSKRAGFHWIIDGQHRVRALEAIGYGDQMIECEIYDGLSEADEAEMFLRRNDNLTVTAFAKFKVSVQAGRPVECAIDDIVRKCGLRVSQDQRNGAVCAVGTLRRVYTRDGADCLARALLIVRDAYGDAGFGSDVIDGFGMLVHRYGQALNDSRAVARLSAGIGGVTGLRGKADLLKRQTGSPRAHCVAAAAVDTINRGQGGKKLPSWWRSDSEVA